MAVGQGDRIWELMGWAVSGQMGEGCGVARLDRRAQRTMTAGDCA